MAELEAATEVIRSLRQAIDAVREVHEPIDAVMYSAKKIVQVCTGCGTDDGNWQRWPCPTIRAINKHVPAVPGGESDGVNRR